MKTVGDKNNTIGVGRIVQISVIFSGLVSLLSIINFSPFLMTFLVLMWGTMAGALLLICFGYNLSNSLNSIVYSVGAGIFLQTSVGLLINFLLPALGFYEPLSKIPLILCFNFTFYILLFFIYFYRSNYTICFPKVRFKLIFLLPVSFFLTTLFGVYVLNNFGINIPVFAVVILIPIYFLVIYFSDFNDQKHGDLLNVFSIYFISLSLLTLYSMRTSHIFGWDINEEYQVFKMTLDKSFWSPVFFPGLDYNGCLSITIFPTIVKNLTNLSSEYIFKYYIQTVFAFSTVISYLISRRFFDKRTSLLASFLFLSQVWFYDQMPAIIRQEVAFVFYLLFTLALFDNTLSSNVRKILMAIFAISVVFSHYSTAYIFLIIISGFWLISNVFKIYLGSSKEVGFYQVIFLLFAIVFWQVGITHTGGSFSTFLKLNTPKPVQSEITVSASGTNVVQYKTLSLKTFDSVFQNLFSNQWKKTFFGNIDNTDEINSIAQATYEKHKLDKDFVGIPDSANGSNILTPTTDQYYYKSVLPKSFGEIINGFISFDKILFIDLFTLLGLVLFIYENKKHGDEINFLIINFVLFSLLVLATFVPYIQSYYNLTRLFLQTFFTLSAFSIFASFKIFRKFRIPDFCVFILVAILFLSSSGILNIILGGAKRITLEVSGGDYENYKIYDSEIAGATWLVENRNKNNPVQADIISNLRLQSFGDMNANNARIFPKTISADSYIYLTSQNIVYKRAYYLFENENYIYEYPLPFIDTHKSLIYSNGLSRIYR